jgi:membrane protein
MDEANAEFRAGESDHSAGLGPAPRQWRSRGMATKRKAGFRKTAWTINKQTWEEFLAKPTLTLSAATAYYAAFSLAPLLVLTGAVAALVFGKEAVQQEVTRQLQAFLGPNSAQLLQSMMNAQFRGGSLMLTVVGVVALVVGATGVFSQLQASLNTIWDVKAKPGRDTWLFVLHRALSLAMVLAMGFLLLVSMVLSTIVDAFTHYLGNAMSLSEWIAPVFYNMVAFIVVAGLFPLVFKILPDVKIQWRDVLAGSIGTALLFMAGKYLLSLYLSHQITASAYGAGSAFIGILLYVYYASMIFYLGAEFTKVYAKHRGSELELSSYAVPKTAS